MSVFNDFQRVWMQRFPQSSLSDAWEEDVRASLERHKQKISELTKELEQESLYVEYLERLLSDVEKYKESGGDPTTLFEAATNSTGCSNATAPDNHELAENKSSLNLRESRNSSNNEGNDKNHRLSLNPDNKYANSNNNNNNNNNNINNDNGNKSNNNKDINNAQSTNTNAEGSVASELKDKDAGTEKDLRIQKNGALNQCITELAATFSGAAGKDGGELRKQLKPVKSGSSSASHFVTVIELKESKSEQDADNASESGENTTQTKFSSFERKSSKVEPSAPPMSPAITTSSMSSSAYATHLEAKKKVPPRPPPKNIRRVEPPMIPGNIPLSSSPKRDGPFIGSALPLPNSSGSFSSSDSPGNSLERNIKPSDILRQKSSESLEPRSYANNRRTTPEFNKFANNPELLEEFGRKIGKTESLEKTKRTELNTSTGSPTGSLGRTSSTPTRSFVVTSSSLSKSSKLVVTDSSSTGSLEKEPRKAVAAEGSKESLASQGIIKSYESVSSLSSDSAKANNRAIDNEPYYDTVPLDGAEGEYVYIKARRTGSSSSRDELSTPGSTMPITAVAQLSSQASVTDPESPERSSNYVNINYFLHQSNETRPNSVDSDGEYEGPALMRTISHEDHTSQTPGALRKTLVSAILESSNARGARIRNIVSSIIQSETIYVECLNKMIQYKKAIHATLGTSQPVIKEEEENTIFFKIDELYELHTKFLYDLKAIVAVEGGDCMIGETFRRVADMFDLYSAFLHNYGQAIETVKKCSANNPQFKKIVSSIMLNLHTEQSLTLEDLLHKPVARVQINALVFNDLLGETPPNHPDHQHLRQAQKTIQMFLKQFNVVSRGLPSDSNKSLRRLVKNSFIVELVDGHRKLRHLFLFNDVIACAKYKPSGRDRTIEYELKWIVPLKDVLVLDDIDASTELKESSPANILQLKTQACTVRDQLLAEEKDEKSRKTNGLRSGDKYRRKLADLESQLVLASPNLVFRISNKATNKTLTFFLSSDFERSQWIESILSLKESCNIPGAGAVNALEVRALIVALPNIMKTEMGSYLMRNTNDESLLIGDLHMTVQDLTGLEQPSDVYICIEVDSYGHYFRKATTKMVCRSASPVWNESFVLELEGSQNVRVLLYEAQERPKLRAKSVLKLSRNWLQETATPRVLKFNNSLLLNTNIRFVPGEVTLRRVPTAKPGALFGAKMSQVLKREKRDIPFIISACIREAERRGMSEVGIYRVSGSASDVAKLKKSFETNTYEAEQLLKDVDIHSVTGILKTYLRELPEALFSDALYPKFFEVYSVYSNNSEEARMSELLKVFEELPDANKQTINYILDHLIRVHYLEADNKMSLHNLAMVFGPTLLRPGQTQTKQKDLLASSTVDVMAQAGILYSFLQSRLKKE